MSRKAQRQIFLSQLSIRRANAFESEVLVPFHVQRPDSVLQWRLALNVPVLIFPHPRALANSSTICRSSFVPGTFSARGPSVDNRRAQV